MIFLLQKERMPGASPSWKAAEKFGLTEAEISSISDYKARYFAELNPIRGKRLKLTPDQQAYLNTLKSAFARLPSYDSGPVYRGTYVKNDAFNHYEQGDVLHLATITSTTTDASTFHNSFFGPDHLVMYLADSGRLLSNAIGADSEKDVTLGPGTHFKVLLKKNEENPNCNSCTVYVLAETDADHCCPVIFRK